MLLPIRQGILRPLHIKDLNQNSHLSIVNNTVSVIATKENNIILTFSFYNKNFLFKEDKNVIAWENLPSNTPSWLYWDLDINSGERTFGYTLVEPTFGEEEPINPPLDQHFFNTKNNTMQVWDGSTWIVKLRVFAATYDGTDLSIPDNFMPNESQVGLDEESNAGYLLFDSNNKTIRLSNNYLNSETILFSQNNYHNGIKLSAKKQDAILLEDLDVYQCITRKNNLKGIGKTTSNDPNNPCLGILAEASKSGAVRQYIINGYVHDPLRFNWNDPPNTYLFVGPSGELTTLPPNRVSQQRVGYIVDRHTIYIDLKEKILIDPYKRPEIELIEPDPEPPEDSIDCGTATQFSGGLSYPAEKTYTLGSTLGTVSIDFEAYNVPDRFIIYLNDEAVYDSGYRGAASYNIGGSNRNGFNDSLTGLEDPITGNIYPFSHENNESDGYPTVISPGAETESFEKTITFPYIILKVYAPMSGTLWNATVNCPI